MKEPILELAFSGGIDQSQRSEILDPRAAFVSLENVRAPSIGAVGKRDGFETHAGTTLVDATSRTAGYRMFAHGKQTCFIDRDIIAAYSPANEDQISRGRVPECGLTMMKVPAPGVPGSLACTDAVRVGEYLALAYTAGQSVYAAVVEAETGQVIVAPSLVYTGSAGEIYGLLGARGTTAMLFITCAGEGDVRLSEVDCSSASTAYTGWSAQSSIASDHNGGLVMAVHSIGSRVYLAYVNDSGGASQLSLEMFDGGAGGTATVNTSSVTPSDVGLGGAAGDTLWVAWNEATAIKVKGLSTTNLATVPASTFTVITAANTPGPLDGIAVVASSTAGAGRLFVNDGGGQRLYTRNFTTSGGAVTPGAATATHFSVRMSGRPFRLGSRYYGVCKGQDLTEKVAILCDLTESNAWVRPVANVAPGLASSFVTCQAPAHSSREFWAPIGVQTAGSVTGVQMAKFDFDADARWRAVAHNGVTFLTGGLVSCFTGDRVTESAFLIRPPQPTLATNGAGSFTVAVGVRVVLVYEQVDAAGNWHISGVSPPSASSGAFSNKVNLAVTTHPLGISGRISAATDPGTRISAYVTADGGEAPYFYAGSASNTLTGPTQTINITAAGSGTALLMSTGNLPNTGAQLDRRAPQGLAHLCSYNGFLVGANGEEVFWTGQDVDGEGAWWNDAFSLAVSGGGDITALDAMEGVLFAFKRDRIYALAGQPPNDTNTEGGLGAPQRIAASVGARSPFTCVTEIGIWFVSDRGIELLNRNRGVDFIGEKVQDTFAAFPYVSAMTYDPVSSCVLIEASAGRSAGLPTGNGRTFVYDIKARVWRSFDRRSVSATADVPAADGCMVWNGSTWKYGWLRSNGASYVETSDSKLDPGDVRVRQYAKTSWIHLGGIQGEQMADGVLLLGEHVDDHDLEVGIANDYADTFVQQTMDSDALAAMAIYNPHFDVAQKTGQSIAIEIEDAAPTGDADGDGSGGAALWVALTINGAAKSGTKRTSTVLRGGTDG